VATGLMVCVTALALALCAGVWWWRSAAADPASAHAAADPASAHAASTAHPTASSTGQHPSGAAPARALAPAQALAVLSAVDGTRSRAYATRNPALLAAVYASANLLARDRAQLLAIVPTGCGLQGLHTRFSRLALTSASADRARLRVTATLAPAGLVCAGTASGATPAARPTALVVDLVRVGTTYRIAAASTDPTVAR
jgi:hypothetical protein